MFDVLNKPKSSSLALFLDENVTVPYWACSSKYYYAQQRIPVDQLSVSYIPKIHSCTLYIGLVLTGGYYHGSERYHDFLVEIIHSENE